MTHPATATPSQAVLMNMLLSGGCECADFRASAEIMAPRSDRQVSGVSD